MTKVSKIKRNEEGAAIDEGGKLTEESGFTIRRKKPEKGKGKGVSAEPNSGETSDRAKQTVQSTGTSTESQSTPQFLHHSNIVFSVQLSHRDVEEDKLIFQAEEAVAEEFLLPLFPPRSNFASRVNIVILDHEKLDWVVTLHNTLPWYNFTITGEWKDIVEWHFLEPMDKIRFYRPPEETHNNSFFIDHVRGDNAGTFKKKNPRFKKCQLLLVDYVKGEESEPSDRTNPEFEECNLLLEHRLNSADVEFGRFRVTNEEVVKHFHVLVSPEGPQYRRQRLKFSDPLNRDWLMEVRFCKECYQYLFVPCDENGGLVREYNLGPLDVIRFYRSAGPSHRRHFRIEYVKLEVARAQRCRSFTIALLVALAAIILIIFRIAFWTTQKWTSK